jgi:hypothetical protein
MSVRSRRIRRRRLGRALGRSLGRLSVVAAVAIVVSACSGLGFGARPTLDTTPVNPIRPRMTATPGPQHVAMAAFVDLVTAEDFSYHVAFKGGVGLSTAQLPIDGHMDVSGADFRSVFTYDFSEEYADLPDPIRLDVRGVDGEGFMRRNTGSWATIKVGVKDQTTPPFWAITSIRDIKHVATEERDSGTFYRISVPRAVLIHPVTIPFNIRAEKVRTTSLEVLIDADGHPAIGTWKAENQARVGDSGQLQGVDYELKLTFSKLGEPVKIAAP